MSWHVFSLVLASATGWTLLLLGYLPVVTLRQLGREPLKGAAAWAVVACTAPSTVFHWYLIFAVICLIALTKLDRPAGKMWLAAVAALGLSLGIIFPLETSLGLLGLKDPLALGSLYLGGTTIALAYVAWRLAPTDARQRTRSYARWLVLGTGAWSALLACLAQRIPHTPWALSVDLPGHVAWMAPGWMPLASAVLLFFLACLAWDAARRQAFRRLQGLALGAALIAFITSLLAQLVFHTAALQLAL